MLIENSGRNYENPNTGSFIGVIADVIDLGPVTTSFGTKVKIRIMWILNANDSEGRPYRVMRQCTASINEKSALYEIVKSVTGAAPPVPFDSETLIGKANLLVIVKETDVKTNKEYANIKAILPLPAGAVVPQIPADFTRSKDRPKTQYSPSNGAAAPSAQAASTTANTATAGGTPAPAVAVGPPVDAQF